jgi:hypothetical protein
LKQWVYYSGFALFGVLTAGWPSGYPGLD